MTYELRKIVGDVEYRSIKGVKLLRGYGAVYESLSQNLGGFVEKFTRGAFAEYISHNPDVLGLRNHDLDQLLARTANPAGTMKVKSDKTGLQYRIVPNLEDPVAVSTVAQVERGDLRGSSVGFLVVPGDESVSWGFTDQGFPLREIHQENAFRRGRAPVSLDSDEARSLEEQLASGEIA